MTVDDHEIFRGGIAFALEAYEDLELVGGAHSGEEALRLCEKVRPDVILMDMRMPGLDGPATTGAIRQQYPQVQVLALTSFYDEQLVQRAMAAGAIGYLLKGVPVAELVDAIRAACAGRSTIDDQALQALIRSARSGPRLGDDLTDAKLRVSSRTEAATVAVKQNLVPT
jgi:NarL family two-component system response regulator LiaR